MALSRDELVRYARHLALRDVGIEGQERLGAARILLVGAGGLGSPAALYLAAAGVGTLGLVDSDRVDATNLQRQVAHGTADIGRLKVASAAERLRDLNPHVTVVEHAVRLDRHNALDLVGAYDLVIDGSDNFPTRYLVNDACVLRGVPFVYGAILRWDGQVSLFATPDGPCYRCLFREPPPPGLVPSCSDAGVFGVLPGVVGTMQALEAMKWVLGAGDSLAGRLLLFDALAARWREVTVPRAPDCPICGDDPTITELIDYDFFCGVAPDGRPLDADGTLPREVEAEELQRRLGSDHPPLIVDVREQWEWDAGHLGGEGCSTSRWRRWATLPRCCRATVRWCSCARSGRAAPGQRAICAAPVSTTWPTCAAGWRLGVA